MQNGRISAGTLLAQLRDAGIGISYSSKGLTIRKAKGAHLKFPSSFDFSDNPDSASTLLIMLAACTHEIFEIKGLESLNRKESRREDNVKGYLQELGAILTRSGDSWQLDCRQAKVLNEYHFTIHQDHRMAMSLAPLALKSTLVIDDPDAVNKSYPGFWQDLKKANFVVQTL